MYDILFVRNVFMKKILSCLFIIQLSMMSFYVFLLLQGNHLNSLLVDDVIAVTLNFDDRLEDYEMFLALFREEDLHVSRVVFLDETRIAFYTTDVTLDGVVTLNTGRYPAMGTNEFVSNIETGETTQVGLIDNMMPDFEIVISGIDSPQNFALDGVYYIHTNNLQLVYSLIDELAENILLAEVSYFREATANILIRGLDGFSTPMQFFEFASTSFVMFLIMIGSSVQYAISKLKSSSIFSLHGYSTYKVIYLSVIELLKLFSLSVVIAYIIAIIYNIHLGYGGFLSDFTLYFSLLSGILIIIYLIIVNIVMLAYLKRSNSISLVKGKKPYLAMQLFNHALKITFTFFFLIIFNFSSITLREMNLRLDHLSYWDIARNVYQVNVTNVGQLRDDFAIERGYSERKVAFYDAMSEYYTGFMMSTGDIGWLDDEFMFFNEMDLGPAIAFSPNSRHRITISPNFLILNPIEAFNGEAIIEQIIFDDDILNILVPERLMYYEEEIVELYLEEFYSQKVIVSNIYNRALDLELNETPIESLSINIIYVRDEQYYFSFDPSIRPETGGRILDPIAVIYTGNLDPSFLSAKMTTSFYFQTDAINAYDEILLHLVYFGLESAIPRVSAVFDQNGRLIMELQGQLIRLVGFMIALVVASLTVTYNLMVNYFERNKFKLFLKGTLGYSPLQRNKYFIISFLGYTIPLVFIIGSLSNVRIFLIGLIFLTIDVAVALVFEKHLQKKSFAEIMKGER